MTSRLSGSQPDLTSGRRPSPGWIAAGVVIALVLMFRLDVSTGAAPFQHLYYVPIVIAELSPFRYAGSIVALAAVVLYHVAKNRCFMPPIRRSTTRNGAAAIGLAWRDASPRA